MLSETELDAILESIAVLPDVVGSVVLSFEAKVIRSNFKTGDQSEDIAYWSLGCFMASEMVAKKAPPYYAQLQHITLITTEGSFCIVWADIYLISTLTKSANALDVAVLANTIARLLLLKSGENTLDFEPC
jgi:predicted regulator of Ras-like GTPase activity (Roadblock/LC7/MglB family)